MDAAAWGAAQCLVALLAVGLSMPVEEVHAELAGDPYGARVSPHD